MSITAKPAIRSWWEHWIAKNRSGFHYPPVTTASEDDALTVRFLGIHPLITAYINHHGVTIFVDNEGGVYGDRLVEFAVYEAGMKQGE